MLARDVYEHLNAVKVFAGLDVTGRLRRTLRMLTGALGTPTDDGRVRLAVRREELAHLVACRPEHVSRSLARLEAEGFIHRESGWLVVPAPPRDSKPDRR